MMATPFKMPPIMIMIIFCLSLMTFVHHSSGSPLPRNQRQTVTNAAGYTSDTITSYQTLGQGNYSPQESSYGGGYDGGSYGGYGQASGGPDRSYGSYDYAGSRRTGYGGQSWRGFGTGKSPAGYRPPVAQSGVKY